MKQALIALLGTAWLLGATPTLAQSRPDGGDKNAMEVPGGEIFGFTDPSDVGDPGDKGIALETTTRIGRAGGGRYVSPTLKTEVSSTIAPNLALSIASFATGHRIWSVPGLDHRASVQFDGFSTELLYRFLERSPGNPFAATIGIEPRAFRVDELTGAGVAGLEAETKLFVDAVLVPKRWYGAMNLTYTAATQRALSGADAASEDSSETMVSGALTYQVSERLFVGSEARWLTAFSGAFLNTFSGQALLAGPTLLIKLGEQSAFNLSWTPQIAGRSQDTPRRPLDLDNFERHQLRVKFATSF